MLATLSAALVVGACGGGGIDDPGYRRDGPSPGSWEEVFPHQTALGRIPVVAAWSDWAWVLDRPSSRTEIVGDDISVIAYDRARKPYALAAAEEHELDDVIHALGPSLPSFLIAADLEGAAWREIRPHLHIKTMTIERDTCTAFVHQFDFLPLAEGRMRRRTSGLLCESGLPPEQAARGIERHVLDDVVPSLARTFDD